MYLDENKGMYPGTSSNSYVNSGWPCFDLLAKNIPGAIAKDGSMAATNGYPDYTATSRILLCPSVNSQSLFKSYGWNAYINSSPVFGIGGNYGMYRNISSMRNASQIFIIADAKHHTLDYWDYTNGGTGLPAHIELRHQMKSNMLFADGHTESSGNTIGNSKLFY